MKTIPALTIICFETKTSLQNLSQYIRVIAHELYLEAAKYEFIIKKILNNKLEMSGQNREIYFQMNFEQPAYNLTEVQIGVVV